MRRRLLVLTAAAVVSMLGISANAAVSVSWVAPADGTSHCLPQDVSPTGQAGASGTTGGTGLDLALVLDSSGSMGWDIGYPKTGQEYQQEAAIALVNALPEASTAVTVIEFDSDANTVRVLSQLTTDKAAIIAAINSVDADGGTNIGTGIAEATTELTSIRHTAGRAQMMVVMSDGSTTGDPEVQAVAAMAAGVDAIHTVGMPGHNVATMQDIADGPDDSVGTADDYGVYTSVSDLTTLQGIFDGTEGNLVGISHVDVTLPDGTFLPSVALDGLGNFTVGPYALEAGANAFLAEAYDDQGKNMASATLTLYGQTCGVPDGGVMLVLLSCSMFGLEVLRRRMR